MRFNLVPLLLLSLLSSSWFRIPGVNSQAQPSFSPGQTIVSAGSSTSSSISSGNFSLGFSPQQQEQSISELGIWYTPDQTRFLVWRPREFTGTASRGSALQLSTTGNLELVSSSSAVLWSSGTSNQGVTTAQFLPSGNLVLQNTSGNTLWSTFTSPADTILPNQNLTTGGPELRSSQGLYSLSFESGNLSLKWNNRITYWTSDSSSSGGVPTTATLDQNGVLRLYVNSSHFTEIFAADNAEDNRQLRRLTLDPSGNLRSYTLLLPGGSWSEPQWQAVEDECKVFNFCGSYGVCHYLDSVARCSCPPGLSLVSRADRTQGCTNTGNVTGCSTSRMVEARNTSWLNFTRDANTFNSNREQCKGSCLSSAACIGVIYPNDGSGRCTQLQTGPLSGYSSPSIRSIAFLKVCNGFGNSPLERLESEVRTTTSGRAIGIAVAATIAGIAAVEAVLGVFLYRRRRRKASESAARHAVLDYAAGAAIRFTYKELENATYGFSEKIGEGGFGAVYKGHLQTNKRAIAVKKLEGVFQGEKEFRTEVATIGSTHHMNLMRLVGFCSEGEHTRLLVYDFMPNGSLDRFLFHHRHDRGGEDQRSESMNRIQNGARRLVVSEGGARGGESQSRATRRLPQSEGGRPAGDDISFSGELELDMISDGQVLDWKTRFRIAVGAARGLAYLHEECRETIVHCDLKPENILLDENFTPKLSDFGLARLIEPGQTRELTTVRGSRGYMAPEWLANMPVTTKSDVYSYGIVLLELIGGRRNFDACSEVPREQQRYAAWAFREVEAGRVEAIVDERMRLTGGFDGVEVERLAKVAFWCLQESAASRPGMSKVVRMLEGNAEVLRPPMPRSLMIAESTSSSSVGGGWGWASTSASTSTSAATLSSSTDSGSAAGVKSLLGR